MSVHVMYANSTYDAFLAPVDCPAEFPTRHSEMGKSRKLKESGSSVLEPRAKAE